MKAVHGSNIECARSFNKVSFALDIERCVN